MFVRTKEPHLVPHSPIMIVNLSGSVARNTSVQEWDIKQIKKVLNRLGYYYPLESIGITGIPDEAVFKGIKSFQFDHGLPVTGEIRPEDKTLEVLNKEAAKTPKGYYIWRTVGDSKVRKEHAKYEGHRRAWKDAPDPGEQFGCRCWAMPVPEIVISDNVASDIKDAFKETKDLLESFDQGKYYLAGRLLRHYLDKTGTTVELATEEMDGVRTLDEAIAINNKRFEDGLTKGFVEGKDPTDLKSSILKDGILSLKDGEEKDLHEQWEVDRDKTQVLAKKDMDFFFSIGSVKIKSKGIFQVKRNGNNIKISGKVVHSFDDIYDFEGGWKSNPINQVLFSEERLLAEKGYAKIFSTRWKNTQKLQGAVVLDGNGDVQKSRFKWKKINR